MQLRIAVEKQLKKLKKQRIPISCSEKVGCRFQFYTLKQEKIKYIVLAQANCFSA